MMQPLPSSLLFQPSPSLSIPSFCSSPLRIALTFPLLSSPHLLELLNYIAFCYSSANPVSSLISFFCSSNSLNRSFIRLALISFSWCSVILADFDASSIDSFQVKHSFSQINPEGLNRSFFWTHQALGTLSHSYPSSFTYLRVLPLFFHIESLLAFFLSLEAKHWCSQLIARFFGLLSSSHSAFSVFQAYQQAVHRPICKLKFPYSGIESLISFSPGTAFNALESTISRLFSSASPTLWQNPFPHLPAELHSASQTQLGP